MADRYTPGMFDTQAPRFNALPKDTPATPGVSADVILTEKGMRGISAEQLVHGITAEEFATVLTQDVADSSLDAISPIQTKKISRADAVERAVTWFALDHVYTPKPAPGFTAAELYAYGWDPSGLPSNGDIEKAHRSAATALCAYQQVLSDPVRMHQVAEFLGLDSNGPDHFVAWVRIDGRIVWDITGAGREGQPYTTYTVMCECSSVYEVNQGGGITTFQGVEARGCLYVDAARDDAARQAGVRFGLEEGKDPTPEQWRNLLDAVANNEWVGQTDVGLFVQTVGSMCGLVSGQAFASAGRAVEAGTIGLDCSVVVMPHPPFYTKSPTDLLSTGVLADGRTVQVLGPAGRYEKNVCQVVTTDAEGGPSVLAEVSLMYEPRFGYDEGDLAAIEEKLAELGVVTDGTTSLGIL